LILESGEPREVHHMATLIGYGCSAINPYLLLDTVDEMVAEGRVPDTDSPDAAKKNVVKAIGKGLLKTISKMGISTIQSYCGAQIFEAVGLQEELVERYFTGTASRIGGIGAEVIARETLERHAAAFPGTGQDLLPVGGIYAWRRDGEFHQWNPETIALVQHAVKGEGGEPQENYDEFARQVNEIAVKRAALRGLLEPKFAPEPIPLEEVEPAAEIVKRFSTGAMSLGSISRES
jgi:glutamate synthase domain-containing protein 2